MSAFKCKRCKKKLKRNENLQLHQQTQHAVNVPKIQCPLWPKCKGVLNTNGLYSTNSNLKVHLKRHHKKYSRGNTAKELIKNAKKVFVRGKGNACKYLIHFQSISWLCFRCIGNLLCIFQKSADDDSESEVQNPYDVLPLQQQNVTDGTGNNILLCFVCNNSQFV